MLKFFIILVFQVVPISKYRGVFFKVHGTLELLSSCTEVFFLFFISIASECVGEALIQNLHTILYCN